MLCRWKSEWKSHHKIVYFNLIRQTRRNILFKEASDFIPANANEEPDKLLEIEIDANAREFEI